MDDAPRRLIFNAEQSGHEALAIPSRDPVVQLTLASDAPEAKKVPRQRAAIPAGLPDSVEQPDPFGPAIDWAFRRYDVSLNTSAEGQVFQPSLYLFNLIVALEWRPDEEYMQMLRSTFTRASDLLFDVTDGWMAFGQVVFGGPELMDCADIQIMASNRLFPRSWVAGLHIDHKYMPIRAGRGLWNDNRRGVIAWEEPEGYRTLIHEWCHYALCLTDEYLESRPVVLPEQVRRPADHLSLVQAPITSLVMPSVRSFSELIMATTEGTSELVSKQWPKLSERFPAVPPDRTDRQVLAGPRWLPAALPRFRRQGSLAGGAADPSISLPAWRELRGELAGLGVPGELKLDRCWVYVLRDAASAAEPARVIAQGTLEASSEDAAFPLLGAHEGDTVALIVERRGDRPTVLRARVAGDRPEGWGATSPTAFPEIDIVPEPADTNDSKAAITLRVGGVADLPDHIEIFPLGYDRPVAPEWQSGAKSGRLGQQAAGRADARRPRAGALGPGRRADPAQLLLAGRQPAHDQPISGQPDLGRVVGRRRDAVLPERPRQHQHLRAHQGHHHDRPRHGRHARRLARARLRLRGGRQRRAAGRAGAHAGAVLRPGRAGRGGRISGR